MECGRQTGGQKVAELGECPAYTDKTHVGVNSGTNAGRYCWKLAGTFCGGKVQGSWAEKIKNCLTCAFFKQVKQEEGSSFTY